MADFHSIFPCAVHKSVGEDLEFVVAASHEVDVVGEAQVAYGPATDGDGGAKVPSC